MDVKSWLGFWHWAHNGCKPNGSITLKEEEDGQRTLHTTFSPGVGTWWPHDQQASSIELEWRSKGGSLVRHTLKANPTEIRIGAGLSGFRVVARHRPSCSTLTEAGAAGGKDGGLSWVPDSRTIRTCGWRERLGTSATALRVSSKLTSAKKYLCHEDPPNSGFYDSLCPNCRRPLNLALGGELLTVTSPLTEAKSYECKEGAEGYCSPCPTCRRPISISKVSGPLPSQAPFFHRPSVGTWLQPRPGKALASKRSRCAYATLLYGTSVEYVRDARVLGFSLRKSGTPHDLVLLHTSDVPPEYLEILGCLWTLRPVDRIDAASTLFTPHSRFRGVFTKLHAWGLIEYERIILLDLDLLVQENVDSLFDLQPPAAMWAAGGQVHGRHIVAPHPFKGYHNVEPWGKVNAGVILLEPNLTEFGDMKQEVECREHPEHIVTTSPEQDYLTRFFWHTPHWTHIDVSYNFQLHHLALRLPDSQKECERRQLRFEDIRILHFSAHPKPSQREPDVSVEAFVEQAMAKYEGVQIYVRHDPEAIERRNRSGKFPKLELRSSGSLSETGTRLFEECRALAEETESSEGGKDLFKEVTVSSGEFQRVREVCLRSFQAWSEAEKQCKERFGAPELLESFPAKLGSQLQGTCVEWNRARGMGWIRPDDGSKLIFVHFNGLAETPGVGRTGRAQLEEGQLVSFSVGLDDKGRRTAVDVKASDAQIDQRPLAEEGREEGSQPAFQERVRGKCKAWEVRKKYGFVSYVDGGQEKVIFLHQEDLLVDAKECKGVPALKVGQMVQFTPTKEEKDPAKLRARFATCTEDDNELVCEVQAFAASDAGTKRFPPGTPWRRKLLHQVAGSLGFFTRSEGEEPNRCVCISKTEEEGPGDSQQKVLRLQARIEEVAKMQGQSDWHFLLGDLTGHEREQLSDFCKLRGLLLCRREAQNAKQCQHFVCREPAAAVLFTC